MSNYTLKTSSDLQLNSLNLPLVIPIRINKEFLASLESENVMNLVFNQDGTVKEINCESGSYALKPNGAVGDNEQGIGQNL